MLTESAHINDTAIKLTAAQELMAIKRKEAGVSYAKVHEHTGIPERNVENFLGRKTANSSTVYFMTLCKYFHLSADELFDLSAPPSPREQAKSELLEEELSYYRDMLQRQFRLMFTIGAICIAVVTVALLLDMAADGVGLVQNGSTVRGVILAAVLIAVVVGALVKGKGLHNALQEMQKRTT